MRKRIKKYNDPNYEDLYRYYKKQRIPILKDNILNLKNVDIKIRTNNNIKNFNKIFQQNFNKKVCQEPVYFLDEIYKNKLNSKKLIILVFQKIK